MSTVQPSEQMFRVSADWPGGGFAYTLPFADQHAANTWAKRKAGPRSGAVITALPRGPGAAEGGQATHRQAGSTTLQTLVAVAAFTLVLAALGPAIDAEPYGTPALLTRADRGELARLEAEARRHCDAVAGVNSGWIQLTDGQIACTDKRGRRAVTRALHRSAP